MQLLNPRSWLAGGNVSLDVEILRRADRQPQAGAQVEAAIEGALHRRPPQRRRATTGAACEFEFPLPPLGKGDLALVIQAQTDAGKDEIRFAMRSRPKRRRSPAA